MKAYEITTNQRINRVIVGSLLILFTMTVPVSPLGWIAVLPLVATLPIFAGIFGYDPVSQVIRHEFRLLARSIEQHYNAGHTHHHS